MLGGAKHCNIYISATSHGEELTPTISHQHNYFKETSTWFLSIEPKKHHIPGYIPKPVEPLHYSATLQEEGKYEISSRGADSVNEILGNILVAENAKASPEQILTVLREKLGVADSSKEALPSENTSDDDPEHWVRKALHVLQSEDILDKFDVGEFMTFAHAYVARRADRDAPAMVAYPKLNKDHEKKVQKRHFWVDYPMESKIKPRNRIEGDQHKYGNLM